MYVRQKALALREDVRVFSDEKQQNQLYAIKTGSIIDFSAKYTITTVDGQPVGSMKRKGLRSIFNTDYRIMDANDQEVGQIREENAWVKLIDGLVGEIPLVGWVITMLINPKYILSLNGQPALRLVKKPAFFEGLFHLEKLGEYDEKQETLALNSILMMLLLERSRG
jgi:hypothetical protein